MIVVVGLSHRSAPIEIRERLALGTAEVPAFLRALSEAPAVSEAFVVSTCNRVEVVAVGRDASAASLEAAARACSALFVQRVPEIERYLYMHLGGRAVHHLFRVASSLDSLVLGEPQILGQLKDGFSTALASETIGPVLHRVLPRAFRTAKRVRSETAVGSGQVSVPTVAVELAGQIFDDLRGRVVALIGSGEMGRSVARLLQDAGAKLVVVGRTRGRVDVLAAEVGGEARLTDRLTETLAEADVVVSSTSSPRVIVTRDTVKQLSRGRRGRNLFFIDLAVPRDIDPGVGELEGTFLYNIDDLSHVTAQAIAGRQREAELAESIVEEHCAGYERWADAEQATPVIKALRGRLRSAFETELERSFRGRLRDLNGEQRAALVKMLDASLNRMLHHPTARLREEATREDGVPLDQLVETLEELFQLRDVDQEAMEASSVRPPQLVSPAPAQATASASSKAAVSSNGSAPSNGSASPTALAPSKAAASSNGSVSPTVLVPAKAAASSNGSASPTVLASSNGSATSSGSRSVVAPRSGSDHSQLSERK